MKRRETPRGALARTWLAPVLLAALTLAGLVAGLLGDGVNDVAACAGLGVPVAVLAWAAWLRR